MSRASLANIEAGRQQVLAHHLIALASALQLESPAQLLLQEHPLRRSAGLEHQLPLSAEGLTNRQRLDVLNLIGGSLQHEDEKTRAEDA